MDLKEEDILGADIGRHWYYRAKAAALRRAVGDLGARRILDVGAGSGFFSRHLLAETGAQSALCVDIGYPSERDDSVAGKPVLWPACRLSCWRGRALSRRPGSCGSSARPVANGMKRIS